MERNHLGGTHTRRGLWKVAGLAAAVPIAASPAFFANSAQAQQTGTWYNIKNRHSGLFLDIRDVSQANGAILQQYYPNGQDNQAFQLVDSGGGYFRIQARHSMKVLDVYNWNAADGADIVQWDNVNGTNQQWQFQATSDGYYVIVNRFSGKALDNWNFSTTAGTRISQYTVNRSAVQQWQLVPS